PKPSARNEAAARHACAQHDRLFSPVYAVAAIAGRYVQIGSEANTSPVTDQARDLDPPQSSRNSQTPHFPFRLLLSRRLTKIGLFRKSSTSDSFFTLPARSGRKPLGKTSPMWEMK